MIRTTIAGLCLAVLAGCGGSSGNDPVATSFWREAGALADAGNFGNATMNNHQYMTGEKRYTYDLSQRFASEVMTTVNFASTVQSWTTGHVTPCANKPTGSGSSRRYALRFMGTLTKLARTGTTKALV